MSKIGFIGMGNMAKALASGFIGTGVVSAAEIYAYAPNRDKLLKNAEEIGFVPLSSASMVAQKSDIILLACKPEKIEEVLDEIHKELVGKAIISIAAGWTYQIFSEHMQDVRIQCIMPNTPSVVGEGIFLFEEKGNLLSDEMEEVRKIFGALGLVISMPGKLLDIATAISGCAPAFFDLIMEAYADAAVKYGLDRETAYRLVASAMVGSGKLALVTGKHPGVLKDEVCSPGGMTIKGVASLEKNGIRNACIECVDAVMVNE